MKTQLHITLSEIKMLSKNIRLVSTLTLIFLLSINLTKAQVATASLPCTYSGISESASSAYVMPVGGGNFGRGSVGAGAYFYHFYKFNTTGIPSGSKILSVNLSLYCVQRVNDGLTSYSINGQFNATYRRFDTDPETETTANIFSKIRTEPVTYGGTRLHSNAINLRYSRPLSDQAVNDLQTAIDANQSWFAIGLDHDNTTTGRWFRFTGHNFSTEANRPTLIVTYITPSGEIITNLPTNYSQHVFATDNSKNNCRVDLNNTHIQGRAFSNHFYSCFKFDISSLAGTTVSYANFSYFVNGIPLDGPCQFYSNIRRLDVDPAVADGTTLINKIHNAPLASYNVSEISTTFFPSSNTGRYEFTLNATGLADLQAAIDANQPWFALSFDHTFIGSMQQSFLIKGDCETNPALQTKLVVGAIGSTGTMWVGGAGVGDERTNWNNANNWEPVGVPMTGSVTIPETTFKPIINGISPELTEITIETGATVTIASNGSLGISGILTNVGTLTVNSGGALVQTVGSTISGAGIYNIRRQIPGSSNVFRYLGTPINDISTTGISGVSATGLDGGQIVPAANCNATAVAAGSPYGNILELREIPAAQVLSNCSQSLWFVKSAGTLQNVRGYAIRANGGQTITFSGTQVNNGLKEITGIERQSGTVSDHLTGPGVTRGWHLVSNPYPSPIAIIQNYLSDQGFDNQIQIWNSASGSWTGTTATAGNPVILAVGQGFQIRKAAEGGSATLSFTNAQRVANAGVQYFNTESFGDYRVQVNVSGNEHTDRTTLFFHENGTANFDSKYDINKMIGSSTSPALFTMAGIERMALNGLPLLNESKSVPMAFYPGVNGIYTLDFEYLESLPTTAMVYIEDKKTGVWLNVREQQAYEFNAQTTDDLERFVIHFEPPVSMNISNETCLTNDGSIILDNPSNVTWNLTLLKDGQEVQNVTLSQGTTEINNLQAGIYTAHMTNNSIVVTEEIVIENQAVITASIITKDNEIILPYDVITREVNNPSNEIIYQWYLNALIVGTGSSVSFAVAESGEYVLRLEAKQGDCLSADEVIFKVENTTATGNVDLDETLRAYPNPANEVVTIVWNEKAVNYETVRIMDIPGRTVQLIQLGGRTQGNQLQLDLTNISEGMYLISLEGKDVRRTVKISIVK